MRRNRFRRNVRKYGISKQFCFKCGAPVMSGSVVFFVADMAHFPEILIFVAPKTTLVPGLLILIFRYAIVGDVKGSYKETQKEMPQREFVNGCGPKGIGRKDRSIVVSIFELSYLTT